LSAGTYTFAIRCVSGTLTGSDLNVVLTISEIKPVPTSINVYGAPTIHGIAGQTGNIQYIATNNIGENINNAV
jgi:hypothetical protein